MSVAASVGSDDQLARLLQIGVVLEEVVEARSHEHYTRLPAAERDPDLEEILTEAQEESAEHRAMLETLIVKLDAQTVPFEDIETLVKEQYASTRPEDFDDLLYDQLHGEETAYKFYDDLIDAVEGSEVTFAVSRRELVETLSTIRAEEKEGVEEVTELMESRR